MDAYSWQAANSLAVLCERLRSENLLVASELENLQLLNEQIDAEQTLLAQLSWIGTHQQVRFFLFVTSSELFTTPCSVKMFAESFLHCNLTSFSETLFASCIF